MSLIPQPWNPPAKLRISGTTAIWSPQGSQATGMRDPPTRRLPLLPPELEERVSTLEESESGEDFDAIAWYWMILLGLIGPGVLLVVGWWL
jgi:hypothetical protein